MNDLGRTIAATRLPLVPRLPEICKALEGAGASAPAKAGAAVLRADPGSGKSTLVPLSLLNYFGGKILMLEPRRAAVLGIASRLAELLGEKVGERSGYAVRLERKVSSHTQIEVITEGLLVRRMQENPSMFDGGDTALWTLIFDEFHERSIHTDLAFALALDLKRMGAKIRLLVMSATLDAEKAAACIEQACPGEKTAVIDCPGRVFPVNTSYRPLPQKASLEKEWATAIADIVSEENLRITPNGRDILVFLPGLKEIHSCAASLKNINIDKNFDILILHGSLPLAEQKKIITPDPGASADKSRKRKVILATNVAETGLTIPGIELVIDTGYARILRFHIPSGMNRLSLEPISGNSAKQRAGRAGRLGPGRCIRLWPQHEQKHDDTPSEIARIDISSAVLECLLWGVKTSLDLPWLQPPSESAWRYSLELLEELEAADCNGRPTETGVQIARLGLEPRLGRLCIAGKKLGLTGLACSAAAILCERDDAAGGTVGGACGDPDFVRRLSLLRNLLHSGGRGIENPWAKRVIQTAADLAKRIGVSPLPQWSVNDEANVGEIAAAAFPDRIAKRSSAGNENGNVLERIFRFPSGREGRVKPPFTETEWLCALQADSGERMGYIRLAVPVSEDTALGALKKYIVTEQTVEWNALIPRLAETKKAGRIILGEKKRSCPRDLTIQALPTMLKEQGLSVLPWEENGNSPRRLLERIRFYVNHTNNADKEFWSDESLAQDAAVWLGPFVWNGGEKGREIIDANGLQNALASRLGFPQKREMDIQAPETFAMPSGRKRHIDYSSGEPVLKIRLQDAFGITGKCQMLGVSVVFHLLSPADRPVQITRDLDGFWSGSYSEVRKDMRGRYPKHYWPEMK